MPRSDRQRNGVQDRESLAEISRKTVTKADRRQNHKICKMAINKEGKKKIKADRKRPQGWKIQIV